ncbi:NAD(P)-dependent oxidoreductase [Halarchaeum salinum]|uniref:NAD(P)H-binding protein n=1 Tax=Halarchaeum salinum TaxID=489912 RepID=A0AAV3S5U0_9EURY
MNVLLLGASGRIGQRIATELLNRGHEVTGVSRSGDIDEINDSDFKAVTGDATDPDDIADLASGHDAVASALGPSENADVETLSGMTKALIEGLRDADVDRLVWTGGAGGLSVGPDTKLIETEDFPEEFLPLASAHIDALEIIREADDLQWSYIAPAALIEPGERTGEYRTADGELVTDEDGESYITMEDFAVAFVDELENGDAIHTQLAVGY